jgi:hypothetical protein
MSQRTTVLFQIEHLLDTSLECQGYGDLHIVTCLGVIVDGVWIGEWIYWLFIHMTWSYKQL